MQSSKGMYPERMGNMLNKLFYGDNLEVLGRIEDETVDLIYLDPPFNSKQNYSVTFPHYNGTPSEWPITAFTDTWRWSNESALCYDRVVEEGGPVSDVMLIFKKFLGVNDMIAYLSMMAPRLKELHRVLKPTGSIYLHCDPTASHYIKILMDSIFGPEHFQNEIIWKRSDAHNDAKQGARRYGRIHDTILFYTKGDKWTWNVQYTPLSENTIEKSYRHVEESTGRRYSLSDITGPGGAAKGNPYYEFLGIKRHWRYSKENMEELYRQGRIYQSKPGVVPQQIRYLDESNGVSLQDIWTDINMLRGTIGKERIGYPTQKPLTLLERIILTSSNEGDVVLDPFCGCGTAIIAAQKLKRKWIGIDITHIAINVLKKRLRNTFGDTFEVPFAVGEPVSLQEALELAVTAPDQFQWWILGLVGAQPIEKKECLSNRIDGKIVLFDEIGEARRPKQILFSIKVGYMSVVNVRDLLEILDSEKAEMGVLITGKKPTKHMIKNAAEAGCYHSPLSNSLHPRIQIISIEELLNGKMINMPSYKGKAALKNAQLLKHLQIVENTII